LFKDQNLMNRASSRTEVVAEYAGSSCILQID
jgi:hypothetical protein